MKNIFSGFRGGIVWVILAVLVVAVSLTAQAPKSPLSNQPVSEVGRYVFWSISIGDQDYNYGFLDTKRGRVWTFSSKYKARYEDLNEWAISDFHWNLSARYGGILEQMSKEGKDTTGLEKKYEKTIDSATAEFAEKIRQKEK